MTYEQINLFPTTAQPAQRSGDALQLLERYNAQQDFDRFSEAEILQTVLTFTSHARNTQATAEKLLDTFGSLKGVLEARPEQLQRIEGVSLKSATLLSMIVSLTKVWERCAMEQTERITNVREADAFCKSLLIGSRIERFYVVALNAQCRILGKRKISDGSLSECSAYPRTVMETALNYNAHSVLLCHNHPGGTCAPSPEDIKSTVQLQKLLSGVGIMVLDHIIVAGHQSYSMVQHGDIDYRIRT